VNFRAPPSRTGAARGRIALSVISAEVFGQPHRRILGICAAERVASSAIFVRACVLRSSEVKFRVPPSWMGAALGLRGGFHCWLFSCVIRVCYFWDGWCFGKFRGDVPGATFVDGCRPRASGRIPLLAIFVVIWFSGSSEEF